MNSTTSVPNNRVVLVEHDPRGGLVLERALADRGWAVVRRASVPALGTLTMDDCDALVLVLDDDDTAIFELLLHLSSQARRPSILLLTRRANARMLGSAVLASLGVDQLVAWPCRLEQLDTALAKTQRAQEPLRLVS